MILLSSMLDSILLFKICHSVCKTIRWITIEGVGTSYSDIGETVTALIPLDSKQSVWLVTMLLTNNWSHSTRDHGVLEVKQIYFMPYSCAILLQGCILTQKYFHFLDSFHILFSVT